MATVTPLSDLEVSSNMVLNLQNRILEVSAMSGMERIEVTTDGTTIKGDKATVLASLQKSLFTWKQHYESALRAADIAAGLNLNAGKLRVRL